MRHMATKHRVDKAQVPRLRDLAWRLLTERFGGKRERMAEALGVSLPTVSRLLGGKQGIAEPFALRLLDEANADPADFGLAPPGPRPSRFVLLSTRPTWAEMEAAARRLYPYVPESAWEGARRFPSTVELADLTPDVIAHLALAVAAASDRKSA